MMLKNKALIIEFNRFYMVTSRKGIMSLTTIYGSPLNYSYCFYPQCHKNVSVPICLKPEDISNRIGLDELYYFASEGGVLFGGCEPLLYSSFIIDFLAFGSNK